MTKPLRFSHVVLKTFDVARLREWYCNALDAQVVFEKLPLHSFITYDEEHHRLGITAITGKPVAIEPRAPGLLHLAFTFRNIGELLDLYERLRGRGEKPNFTVNHGPTISFYYNDPDGNGVEFLIDRYGTAQEAQAFIDEVFDKNPVGVAYDPEQMLAQRRAGATDEQLTHYDLNAPMVLPPNPELAH